MKTASEGIYRNQIGGRSLYQSRGIDRERTGIYWCAQIRHESERRAFADDLG